MNVASLDYATKVYSVASKCEITRHWVDHAGLYSISRDLQSLSHTLKSEAEEDYWWGILGPLRRLAFTLCSTPLPFNHPSVTSCINWNTLHHQVRLCQQIYPDLYDSLFTLVQKLEQLTGDAYSPYAATLESLGREHGKLSVIIHNPRMNQTIATYFTNNFRLRDAKVISARQLREENICDVLVTIGPCRWFPTHIFLAPHAQHIHVISPRWIRDHWEPGPVFLSDSKFAENKSSSHYIGRLPKIIAQTAPHATSDMLLPEKIELSPPVQSFRKVMLHNAGWQPSPNEETVQAKLCHLSGDRAVFISADEGASQLIIELSKRSASIVKRMPTSALEPDLYLLLRTSGGGDFIAPLAERILGPVAEERRRQQAEWKNQLFIAAQKKFGALSRRELSARLSSHLCQEGSSRARPANIHYWMSSKCIRPRKEEDFAAILLFAGMANRTRELWEAMGEIDRAHIRAGQTIRRMLLQRIATISLEPLERDGEMVFDIGEQDGGTLSAFQITQIQSKDFDIPVNLIGVLLDFAG